MLSILIFIASFFQSQNQTVAYIEIMVDQEGNYYYKYGYDGEYFQDVCKILTFCAMEGHLSCGEEVMIEYSRDFSPSTLPQEQIGKVRKF